MILQKCSCNHEVIQVKHKEKVKKKQSRRREKTLHNVAVLSHQGMASRNLLLKLN